MASRQSASTTSRRAAAVTADLKFALVPEWLLDTDVSAQAVRLYAVISRYADADGRNAYPSRKTLAERLKVKDKGTVDRALKELVTAGAITVRGRLDDAGDQASNEYVVHRTSPAGVAARNQPPSRKSAATGRRESSDGGRTKTATVAAQIQHDLEPHDLEPLEREEPHLVDADAPTSDEPIRDDVERLCTRLADAIEANGSKRPAITKAWRTACRLLLDRDHRTEEQVAKAIDWCQADEFWRSNILSMPKLRQQYDRLRLAAQRRGTTAGTTSSRVQGHLELAARLAARDSGHGPAPPAAGPLGPTGPNLALPAPSTAIGDHP